MPTYVFVVIVSRFSENTLMVNVLGVFDHMHRATAYVAYSKGQDQINHVEHRVAYSIEKHAVSTGCVRTDVVHNAAGSNVPLGAN